MCLLRDVCSLNRETWEPRVLKVGQWVLSWDCPPHLLLVLSHVVASQRWVTYKSECQPAKGLSQSSCPRGRFCPLTERCRCHIVRRTYNSGSILSVAGGYDPPPLRTSHEACRGLPVVNILIPLPSGRSC